VNKQLSETDELITLIYQGPLEAKPWQSFVRCLRRRMDCDIAAVMLRSAKSGAAPLVVLDGFSHLDEKESQRRVREALPFAHTDPLTNALSSAKSGTIYTLDEIISEAELESNAFHKNVIRRYGLEHELAMCVMEPNGWKSYVGLQNSKERGNFAGEEKKFFAGFYPHFERALQIYARLKTNDSEKQIFEDALDRLSIGVFILDGNGKVIDINKAGRDLAVGETWLTLSKGRIAFAGRKDNTRLDEAIKDAARCHISPGGEPFVDAFNVGSTAGSVIGVLVRSVSATDPYSSETSPSVVVYMSDIGRQRPAPEKFIARLFGLTTSEALLVTLLANGSTLADAAAALNITKNTVRNYLKIVFYKTGVSWQADLVRLILKSVALLA